MGLGHYQIFLFQTIGINSSKNSFYCVPCNRWIFVFLLHIYLVRKSNNGKLVWCTCINNIFGFNGLEFNFFSSFSLETNISESSTCATLLFVLM